MAVSIESLQVEHHESGFGLDSDTPRLSWRFSGADGIKDWSQSRYEITVDRGEDHRVFSVDSNDNVLVPWPDRPLVSRERATLSVRAMGNNSWTAPMTIVVEGGFFHKEDWKAEVAGGPKVGGERGPLRPVRVWGSFQWDGQGKTAR
jgi:alpha-L-rhamnosidase